MMAEVSDEPRLLDERLQQLLKSAEQRLKLAEADPSSRTQETNNENSIVSYDPEKQLVTRPYVAVENGVARSHARTETAGSAGSAADIIRHVEDPVVLKQRKRKAKKATAGGDWYNLPRTKLTPEAKRDFQLLQMRNVLDTHRHYRKSDNTGKIPEFSQPGTVVEGPTEFYSGRIQKRDRKQTLAEEILATEASNQKFKAKYAEIQEKKTSGRIAHYKKKLSKRKRLPTG